MKQTATLQLSKGKSCIIDLVDFPFLSQWKWFALEGNGFFYAARNSRRNACGKRHTIRLHRMIMKASAAQEVDHKNRDTLDNRRGNLRITDRFGNNRNRGQKRGKRGGFKGVFFHKATGKWQAQIGMNGVSHYLGLFETPDAASVAYDRAALKMFREFAVTNKQLAKACDKMETALTFGVRHKLSRDQSIPDPDQRNFDGALAGSTVTILTNGMEPVTVSGEQFSRAAAIIKAKVGDKS